MEKLPLDTSVELFKWGPVPGRVFLNSDFVEQMYPSMPSPYEAFGFPKALFIFKGERMIWVNEFPEVHRRGKEAFTKFFLRDEDASAFRASWDVHITALSEYQEKLTKEYLAGLSDAEFTSVWKKFYALLSSFWVPGIVIELANYASDVVLGEELAPYIQDEKERNLALSTLAGAEVMTFYQEEELALSETDSASAHQKEYFWIHNSYSQVSVLPVSFFEERKKELSKDLRGEYERQLEEAKAGKAAVKERYSLPDSVMHTAFALWRALMWQDERKMHILKSLHYKKLFLEEAGKRLGKSYEDLFTISSKEATRLLEDSSLLETAKRRGDLFGFYLSEEEGEVELDRDTVARLWDIYAEPKADEGMTEFKGTVVSRGTTSVVQGHARIRLNAYATDGFMPGDILVAPMTSPEYIFLMKQAGAIITDTGGLTSHAAVVSREMGKLCVVNTKVATQVLKDGDLVEIDAEKGIVRKI